MKIRMTVELDVDVAAYAGEYGMPREAVPSEVEDHVVELLAHCNAANAGLWEPTYVRRHQRSPRGTRATVGRTVER